MVDGEWQILLFLLEDVLKALSHVALATVRIAFPQGSRGYTDTSVAMPEGL